MEKARIDDPALDIPAVCEHLWQIIGNLGIVRNRALIVPGTQALHHVLPDLVPAPRTRRRRPSPRTFTALAQVARAVKPAEFTGQGWRTSRSKILDNAIIGYSMLNEIACIRTGASPPWIQEPPNCLQALRARPGWQ